jgi:hypothetical protein
MDIKLTTEVLEKLKVEFKDCLCPKCLNVYAVKDI